jgi:hypothetical protein
VLGSSNGGRLASAIGEFPTDYISHAGRVVGQCVDFFEKPTSSDRASAKEHVRRVRRIREEHAVEPKTGTFNGAVEYWHVRR